MIAALGIAVGVAAFFVPREFDHLDKSIERAKTDVEQSLALFQSSSDKSFDDLKKTLEDRAHSQDSKSDEILAVVKDLSSRMPVETFWLCRRKLRR